MTYYAAPGIPRPERNIRKLTIGIIRDVVCDYYQIPRDKVFEKNRKREFVLTRYVIFFFAKSELFMSLHQIAQFCGGQDHTTVVHGIKTLHDRINTEDSIRADIEILSDKINDLKFNN